MRLCRDVLHFIRRRTGVSVRPVHVLLAWELGANQGHVTALGAVARELRALGAQVTIAAQRLDALRALRPLPEGLKVVQSPVWPGLLVTAGFQPSQAPVTFGDILANLGLRDSGVVEFMLLAWDGLLAGLRPDLVIADFAPMAQLAARGRIPVVAIGNGFTLPPCQTQSFPRLRQATPLFEEARLLEAVNLGLMRAGGRGLDRLPDIFAADLRLPHTFKIFDPYGSLRQEPLRAPILPGWTPTPKACGDEVFVYFSDIAAKPERIYDALAGLGKGVRLYIPNLPAPVASSLAAAGVAVEPKPLTALDIARRSNLVVSHGGAGLVSMTLAAGLPQLVLAPDLEKRLIGGAVAKLGVGHLLAWRETTSAQIIEAVHRLRADDEVRERAISIADNLAPHLSGDSATQIAEAALRTAGRL